MLMDEKKKNYQFKIYQSKKNSTQKNEDQI
jgi:hypothetical protein